MKSTKGTTSNKLSSQRIFMFLYALKLLRRFAKTSMESQ